MYSRQALFSTGVVARQGEALERDRAVEAEKPERRDETKEAEKESPSVIKQKQIVLERIRELKKQLGKAHEVIARIEEQRRAAVAEAEEASKKYDMLVEKCSGVLANEEKMRRENERLRATVKQVREETRRLKDEVEKMREERQIMSAELRQARGAFDEIMEVLDRIG